MEELLMYSKARTSIEMDGTLHIGQFLWGTLIRFGKFGEITVLMEKNAILTQTQVISTQWTLKRTKK